MKITQTVFEFSQEDLRSITPQTIRALTQTGSEQSLPSADPAAQRQHLGHLPSVDSGTYDVQALPVVSPVDQLPPGYQPVLPSAKVTWQNSKLRAQIISALERLNTFGVVVVGILLGLLILRYFLNGKKPNFSNFRQETQEQVIPSPDGEPKPDAVQPELNPDENPHHKGLQIIPTFPIEQK